MLGQLPGDVVDLAGQLVVGGGLMLGQLLDAVVNLAYQPDQAGDVLAVLDGEPGYFGAMWLALGRTMS